jgi:hypothetical protein
VFERTLFFFFFFFSDWFPALGKKKKRKKKAFSKTTVAFRKKMSHMLCHVFWYDVFFFPYSSYRHRHHRQIDLMMMCDSTRKKSRIPATTAAGFGRPCLFSALLVFVTIHHTNSHLRSVIPCRNSYHPGTSYECQSMRAHCFFFPLPLPPGNKCQRAHATNCQNLVHCSVPCLSKVCSMVKSERVCERDARGKAPVVGWLCVACAEGRSAFREASAFTL